MNIFIKRAIALFSSAAMSMSALSLNYDIASSVTNIVKASAEEISETQKSTTITAKDSSGKPIDNGVVYLEVGPRYVNANRKDNGIIYDKDNKIIENPIEDENHIFRFTVETDSAKDIVNSITTSDDRLKAEIISTEGNIVTVELYFADTYSEISSDRRGKIAPDSKSRVACFVDSGEVSTNFDVQFCESTDSGKIDVKRPKECYSTGSYEFYYGYKDSNGDIHKDNLNVGIFGQKTTDNIVWEVSDKSIATISSNGDNTATFKASSDKTGKVTVSCKAYSKATGELNWQWKEDVIVAKNNPANKIIISETENDTDKKNVITSLTLNKNAKKTLYATYEGVDTSIPVTDTYALKWSSSDDKVVTVDNVGNITAVGAGTATIKIQGSATNEHNVPVNAEVVVNVISPITDISFMDENGENEVSSAYLKTKRSVIYKAVLKPSDANEKITWKADKDGILTIEELEDEENTASNIRKIKVTGIKVGNCNLIASVTRDGKEINVASMKVSITESIQADSVKVYVGDASGEKVAEDDVLNGTIDVYESIVNGGKTYGGQSVTIKAYSYANGSDAALDDTLKFEVDNYDSYNSDSIKVTDNGDNTITIQGVRSEKDTKTGKPRDIKITVTNEFSGAETSFMVHVLVPAVGIQLSETGTKNIEKDSSFVVSSKLLNDKDSNPNDEKIVSWTSSDEDKVTVKDNGDGTATVTSTGKLSSYSNENIVTITAKTTNGLEASFKVKVYMVKSVSISGIPENGIQNGKNCTLNADVIQDDGTEGGTVEWSSSDEKVATVDEKGNVTAVGIGEVTIYAKTKSLDEPAKAKIIVWDNISNAEISGIDEEYTYIPGGKEVTPVPVVKYGEDVLKAITTDKDGNETGDYKVTYSDNINVNTSSSKKPTVTITGDGIYYRGSTTVNFNILPKNITDEDVAADQIADQIYTGKAITPEIVVKATVRKDKVTLDSTKDYTVKYENNIVVCDKSAEENVPTVTITAKGNYTGTVTLKFTIKPYNIKDFTVSDIKDQTYNGKEITPEFTVSDKTFGTLKKDTDYTVTYKNNVNAGNATIVVTGKGNFTGTVTKEFTIVPKAIVEKDITFTSSYIYTGEKIIPDDLSIKSGELELVNGTDFDVTYENNLNVTYNEKDNIISGATINIKAKGNFSGEFTKKFTINPKDINDKDIAVAAIPVQRYVNAPIEPEEKLLYNGKEFVKDTDFTVEYSNNINESAEAEILITGKGNFTGKRTEKFVIKDTDVNDSATEIKFFNAKGAEVSDNGNIYLDVDEEKTYDVELSGKSACDDFVMIKTPSKDEKNADAKIISVTYKDGKVYVKISVKAGGTEGTYKLPLTTYNGEVNKTVYVRVLKPAESIKINTEDVEDLTANGYTMVSDHSVKLSAEFTPSDSTDTVEWSVDKSELASIAPDGTLTALKNGTVTVTAKIKSTENSERGLTQSCKITIIKNNPITSMSLDSNVLNLMVGVTKKLTLTKVGNDTTYEPTDMVKWTSSDEKVATVDEDGRVKALSVGYTIITVTSEYGISVDCLVNVSVPSMEIKADSSVTIITGSESEITVSLVPETASEVLTWTSGNEEIATVVPDENTKAQNKQKATIKGLKAGTCSITVSTNRSADDSGKVPEQRTITIVVIVTDCTHSETYEKITKQPTETEAGLKDVYCKICNKLLKQNVPVTIDEVGEKIKLGDANNDEAIDSKDAVVILKYYAAKLANSQEVEINKKQADINGDGNIDSKDAVMVLRYYANELATGSGIPMEIFIKRYGMLQFV
ncbi:MAG: Ig-like domain-containing protein [Oscillospiraceae bacterium]|nr:Ig-like domain-containing protein [Oscillospiraceae bacterium]